MKISTTLFTLLLIFADNITVEEGEQIILNISEPKFWSIGWFYGSCMIANYNRVNNTVYYGQYCPEPNEESCHCLNSSKGELDSITGSLTIYSAVLSDENFYFYNFTLYPDRGNHSVIYLEVHGKKYLI